MLVNLNVAKEKILKGETLLVAGDHKLLIQLPKGSWIGGTIPYFIAENGGQMTKEKVFITELDPKLFLNPKAVAYSANDINQIASSASEESLTFLILPFGSQVLLEYAKKAPGYTDMYLKPIVGWISGMDLAEIGTVKASVINGFTGEIFTDKGISLRCDLPKGRTATIGIVNIFEQGKGDTIEFLEESFDIKDARINGKDVNFYDYLVANNIDTKLPLVGNFSGAMVNVSFMGLNKENREVNLYAPVFKDMVYKLAAPVGEYSKAFEAALKAVEKKEVTFSCNCILNFLYGELEGKKTGKSMGPITFGEIAYQLVNQTFVYVEI